MFDGSSEAASKLSKEDKAKKEDLKQRSTAILKQAEHWGVIKKS